LAGGSRKRPTTSKRSATSAKHFTIGKALYDRIVVFTTHFQKVGSTLESAVDAFNSSVTSLESRLMVTGRRLSELGARSDKELFDPKQIESRPRQLSPIAPPDSDAA